MKVWLPALLAAAVAGLTWSFVLDLELIGWDGYPMIAAARVESPGDVVATFGDELMGGRYPLGSYWRPVVHLAFALDHAVWGLDPFGYHLTDLLLLAASAGLAAALAARMASLAGLPGAAIAVAGAAAGLAFALHPLHFEILPVAPRRSESLALVFTLLAALAASRGAVRPARALAIGLLCALALASKETGIVSLAVAAAVVAARRDARVRELWPALLPVALALAVRTAALGGLGGSSTASPFEGVANAPAMAVDYARRLAFPPALGQAPWALGAGAAAVLAAVLLAVPALQRSGRAPGRLALVLGGWAALLLVLSSTSGLGHDWYPFPFLGPWTAGVGLLAAAGWGALGSRARALGASSLALAGVLALLPALGSPLARGAREYRAASEVAGRFLGRFERAVRAADPGDVVELERVPTELVAMAEGAPRRKVYILGPYSLEAYADLVLDDVRVRVHFPGRPSERPDGPDAVDVRASPAVVGLRPE